MGGQLEEWTKLGYQAFCGYDGFNDRYADKYLIQNLICQLLVGGSELFSPMLIGNVIIPTDELHDFSEG